MLLRPFLNDASSCARIVAANLAGNVPALA